LQYKKIYNLININEEKHFKNLIQLSSTKWLSRYNVIKRILEHWIELKTFFGMVGVTEKCYKSRMICDILNDDKVKVYFQIILPILEETNNLNLRFQSDECDTGSAYTQLFVTIQSLAQRLIKPLFLNIPEPKSDLKIFKKIGECIENELSFLPIDIADFGYQTNTLLNEANCRNADKQEIKNRFFKFMIKLLKELISRMPTRIEIYKNIKLLNLACCLNTQQPVNFSDLPLTEFILPGKDRYPVENQWRKIVPIDWKTEFVSNNFVAPNNVLQFWPVVHNYIDGSGQQIFKELSSVVLKMLSLPISKAVVERVFSVMNNVKPKVRNKMKLTTLNAIIITRIYLYSRNICCNNFSPTVSMLNLFDSNIYNENTNNVDISDNLDIALELLSNE
jgi:hypothetical protein